MKRLAVGLAVLVTLLGACTTVPGTITYQDVDKDYYKSSLVSRAALDGKLPAEVVGAPLPGVGPEAALAPLTLPSSVSPRRLFSYPQANLRVVLVFHPKAPLSRAETCLPGSVLAANAGDPASSEFSVLASLCEGERQVSTAIASGPRPTSVNDPAYAATVDAALLELMPLFVFRDPVFNF